MGQADDHQRARRTGKEGGDERGASVRPAQPEFAKPGGYGRAAGAVTRRRTASRATSTSDVGYLASLRK